MRLNGGFGFWSRQAPPIERRNLSHRKHRLSSPSLLKLNALNEVFVWISAHWSATHILHVPHAPQVRWALILSRSWTLTQSDYKAHLQPLPAACAILYLSLEGRVRSIRYYFEKLWLIWMQGAQDKMPFLQHALDSQLESLALEQVVPALLDQGFFYVDHFLGDIAGHMVLGQVKRMHYCGLLNDGQLARRSNGVCRSSIRGDKITWVNGTEGGTEAVNFLLTLIDKLISLCVSRLGKSIRARSKVSITALRSAWKLRMYQLEKCICVIDLTFFFIVTH